MYRFEGEIFHGKLIRRYKRFFADIELDERPGEVITAHTPNTGSMRGLLDAGNPVLVGYSPKPGRKLQYTLHAINVDGCWVGCNTSIPNQLVKQAIKNGHIEEFCGFKTIRPEAPIGSDKSRIDLLLSDHENGQPNAFIEIKNVTLRVGDVAQFPDAVTERGTKHLRHLMAEKAKGNRAAMVFVVQRTDCQSFAPAEHIDKEYAATLRLAIRAGVEVYCVVAQVSSLGVQIVSRLPLLG